MYSLNDNLQLDKRSPQQIHKAIVVAWRIVCSFFRAREGTIHGGNNGTTHSSTPITPFQMEGVPNCID